MWGWGWRGGRPHLGAVPRPGASGPALFTLTSCALTAFALTSCELSETTTTEGLDRVVVEALIEIDTPEPVPDPGSRTGVSVFLHRTLEGPDGASQPVDGARVELVLPGGARLGLEQVAIDGCVTELPAAGTGSCYVAWRPDAPPAVWGALAPGARVELDIETQRGERLTSVTRIPQSFELRSVLAGGRCAHPADVPLPLEWGAAEGAWGYLAEAAIAGLPEALAPEGIEVDDDPLVLTGVAVSSADTTIVFPSEFGVFDRFDLERDLAVRLQVGVPVGIESRVSIAAVDRNYVNWVRGGNFNPSGQVRVPSVQGDGTGFFGSTVVRWFDLQAIELEAGTPPPDGPICVVQAGAESRAGA